MREHGDARVDDIQRCREDVSATKCTFTINVLSRWTPGAIC